MAISTARVTVTSSATALSTTDTYDAYDNTGYASKILVKNPAGGTTVYVGGLGVTSSTGIELAAGEFITIALRRNDVLYAITASGSQAIHVLYQDVVGG